MIDKYWEERSRALTPSLYEAPFPHTLPENKRPHPYQHAGVEYALHTDNCIIADEPGVGKTLQAILISNAIEAKRTLVICPASLRLNWEKEINLYANVPNVYVRVVKRAAGDGVDPAAQYVVCSYDALRNKAFLSALMGHTWDHCILDEAHFLKDPQSKRAEVICASDMLPSVVHRFTCLTGTPMPNQPREIYTIARLCGWHSIDHMSMEDFVEHYYALGGGMVRKQVWDEAAQANISKVVYSDEVRNVPRGHEELQRKLRSTIMVRRGKAQVNPMLPAKTWNFVPIEASAAVRRALAHPGWGQAQDLYEADHMAFEGKELTVDGQVATARRELGEAKAEQVVAYVKDLLNDRQKVVVAAWHTSVMAILEEGLRKYGLVILDSKTNTSNRQKIVEKFQVDPEARVLLGQMLVAGTGHTLTASADVVLAEASWTAADNDQMVDRCHRYGQHDNVIGHVMCVPGSLDERIVARAIEKAQHANAYLDKIYA